MEPYLKGVASKKHFGLPEKNRRKLSDRKLELEKGVTMSVTCGVPQGSVLGPVLWNLIYDGILNIDMPEGVETIAFADDLAVVTTTKTEEQLMRNTNKELHKIAASKNKL